MRVRWAGQCPVCPVTSRNPRRPGEFCGASREKRCNVVGEGVEDGAAAPGSDRRQTFQLGGHLCARDPVVLGDQLVEIDRDCAVLPLLTRVIPNTGTRLRAP